jgi:hypothetical protein
LLREVLAFTWRFDSVTMALVHKWRWGRSQWPSGRLLNEEEWLANAEHTLAWIVETLHQHDPDIPSRVKRRTFHSRRQW